MSDREQINFERIEKAIAYINDNFKSQPSLEEVAAAVHLSPYHFQRMFSEWVGVSPKKFTQYISLDYAKTLLRDRATLAEAAHAAGLSGSSRLHDLFVNIEAMTPGEFKNGGAALFINYSFFDTPFGNVIAASTAKGVCHIFFEEDEQQALEDLKQRFPNAHYSQVEDEFQRDALRIFQEDWSRLDKIKLHLAGTPFQLKVWESLLKIPMGALATYSDIAREIDKPQSARAVGSAIGSNPVAFLIPCHRVIQSSGGFGGYRWGPTRKAALIGWEASRLNAPAKG